MPTSTELVSWARDHAIQLEADMTLHPKDSVYGYGAYWGAAGGSLDAESKIRSRAIAALAFLERYAGKDSLWATKAHHVFDKGTHSMETGARALGDVLRAWADQVEAGIVTVPQAEAQGVRVVASTDLMEQVRKLNEDKDVTPAAPIMLAGAALEIALRSAVEELGQELPAKHSISAYSGSLRAAGLLSVQDVKDVEQMGGMRNQAAHGEFEVLSRERAGLMEQQVNQFLRRLAELIESSAAVPALP
ncbi:MAG: hypothetical protein JWN15_4386 [Firmicutes bacterium]|nr:hypothetical protein [Bacillota bacterium]